MLDVTRKRLSLQVSVVICGITDTEQLRFHVNVPRLLLMANEILILSTIFCNFHEIFQPYATTIFCLKE